MSQEPETETPQQKVTHANRRAGSGLDIAAVGWTLVLLFAKDQDDQPMRWVIPIASAAISVLCFSRYRNSQYR
jgi:hypothetical protein